jgi:hypothetical protein
MRFVLALLAVMALLVSPVTAAVAQAACGHDRPMAMTGEPTEHFGNHRGGVGSR